MRTGQNRDLVDLEQGKDLAPVLQDAAQLVRCDGVGTAAEGHQLHHLHTGWVVTYLAASTYAPDMFHWFSTFRGSRSMIGDTASSVMSASPKEVMSSSMPWLISGAM